MIEPVRLEQMRMDYARCAPWANHLVGLLYEVASENGMDAKDLLSKTRRHAIAHPRQEFMRRARKKGFSTPKIAEFLGLKDHTTVLHGSEQAAKRIVEATK